MKTLQIKIFGVIGDNTTLQDIIKQVNVFGKFDQIHLLINSVGGYVSEGRAIRGYLNSLKKPIITECFGECSSIATEIFLMGKERYAHEGVHFLVHQPFGFVEGNRDDLNAYQMDLAQIEREMIEIYQSRDKLKRSYKEWLNIMRKSTTFTAQELLTIGFATKVIKAFQSKYSINMAKNVFARIFRKFGLAKALDYTLQDGTIIEVVTENPEPAVGDSVIIKETGEPAPDGEHDLGNGLIIVVQGGVIVEIKNMQDASLEELAELVAALKALKEDTEKQISALKSENEAIKKALLEIGKVDIKAFLQDNGKAKGNFQPKVNFKRNYLKQQ